MMKASHRQTEVGIIPEDWEVKPLKHISPSQSVGLVINPSTYYDDEGSVPMLVGSQIYENRVDWESAKRISEVSNNLLSASRLAAGDLVTVRVGYPGVTAVIPSELDRCNCASMMIVRQHPSFSSHWLCYMMNSRLGRSQVEHVQYGTAQKQFNISDAVGFLFPVPPLSEQRVIAQVLSDVDALIAALDKLIAKKRDIKTAAMQQLLTGKKRLPGFGTGQGHKRTELGLIPQDWICRPLGELLRIRHGKSQHGIVSPDGKYPILATGGVIGRTNVPLYAEPSVLIGRKGTIDVPRYMDTPFWTVDTLFYSEIASNADPKFIFYKFCLIDWYSYNEASGVPSLNAKTIEKIDQAVPETKNEQKAIAEVLSDMDTEIAALEARRAKTQAVKQGMMQELLTGRTRLHYD